MIDLTKPVQTRAGYPARILCTDIKGEYRVFALIDYGGVEHCWYFKSETCRVNEDKEDVHDLINVPEEVTVSRFAVLVRDNVIVTFNTRNDALSYVTSRFGEDTIYRIVELTGKYTR